MKLNKIESTKLEYLASGKEITNLSAANLSGIFEADSLQFPQQLLSKGFEDFLKNPTYTPEPQGDLEARKALSNYYARRDFSIPPEQILITSGTSESYFHLFKMLAKPGEEILFPKPGYPLFEHIAGLAEIKLSYYSLDENKNWQIDLQGLKAKITPKTKAIVIISPNNPTGGLLSVENLNALIQIAKKNNLPIISDEVFSEFIFDSKTFPRIANMTNELDIFTLSGVSKTYALPGLKISWIAISGPQAINYKEELEVSIDTFLSTNQISQKILPQLLNKGENFLKDYKKYVEENRNLTIQILSKNKNIHFHKPEGGFYLFAQIKNIRHTQIKTDEDFVIALLKETGLFIHPGYFYDHDKGIYILICFLQERKNLEVSLNALINSDLMLA